MKDAIRIYGVPMDLGQTRRGVDMGPSAIRYAGLQHKLEQLGYEVSDGGNVNVPVVEEIEEHPDDGRALNAAAVGAVCRRVHECMCQTINSGDLAIFLGGDHSMALGTVSAVLERPQSVGVLWIDAHGDFNTPQTTPSGNVHGMVVTALMHNCPPALTIGNKPLQPDQIVFIGTRDLDHEERLAMRDAGVRAFTMRDIDENGMASVVYAALNALGNVDVLHVSLDMDALDPRHVPGVGTPVPGGVTYREAHLLMEILADDGRTRSLDIVEVNPILDTNNRTAHTAVELAASLFGQRIL